MELRILDYIQTMRTPFGDIAMPVITALGNVGIIWIVLTAILLIIPKTRKTGIVLAVSLVFDLVICNCFLKPIVARVRPYDVNTAVQLLVAKPKDYSFPSGHTSASFAVTSAFFFYGNKKMGWASLILSWLIAFSRLYLYVHYPTDVLGGIIIGVLCGYLGCRIFPVIEKKLYKKDNT